MDKNYKQDIKYDYWWAGMERVCHGRMMQIAQAAGSARRLFEMDRDELVLIGGISDKYADDIIRKRSKWNIDEEYDKLLETGIEFIPFYDVRYPKRLSGLTGHPFALFLLGELPPDDKLSVAVIGTRNCSGYGRMMAGRFGSDLASYGVSVVSGMAYGIDGIGQEAALNAGGMSYAVLGCGVNRCYPASNKRLYERLKAQGGIISEYGLYTEPAASLFPPRNRIISGLSDAVLVVEAREKSGTMITVDMALEQGREVCVVPGRITDPLSTGCIKLWKQGATPVTCAEDIMYMLDEMFEINKKKAELKTVELPAVQKCLYEHLEPYAKSIGQLSDETQTEFREAVCALVELCIKGLACETGKGYYVRIKECKAV